MRRLLLLALLISAVAPGAAGAAGAGSTLLVSRPDGLGPVPPGTDGSSFTAGALSDDGRYAVFRSNADGLTPDGASRLTQLFVRDTRTGTTTLVSRSDGPGGEPAAGFVDEPDVAVTADGHLLVAFETDSSNFVDHATGRLVEVPRSRAEVWLRDVTAGTTTLVSRAGRDGPPADQVSESPRIGVTAGGPVVAFHSAARNLGPTVRNGGVYLRTLDAGTTTLVSCRNRDCSGTPHADDSDIGDLRIVPAAAGGPCPPALHPTGACVLVAFETIDNTISGDRFRHVILTALNAPARSGDPAGPAPPAGWFVVSRKADGTFGNQFSQDAALSSDGRAVAFLSGATNLTADTLPANPIEAYVWHFDNGAIELVSKGPAGAADDRIDTVVLGGGSDHLRAAFGATVTNLGGNGPQVYLRDLRTQATSLLNRAPGPDGAPGDAPAQRDLAISADGSAALFSTASRNLGGDTRARFSRVYVRRLADPAEPVELVSRPDGNDPPVPSSDTSRLGRGPSVSGDGRFVVFESPGPPLAPGAGEGVQNVYVRDLLSGRTLFVSRAGGAQGAGADGDSRAVAISADGRRVVFDSTAGNLDPDAPAGTRRAYVRDLETGTTTLASRADGAAGAPGAALGVGLGISADGRYALFATSSLFDPAADDGQFHLYVRDLDAGTTTLADRDSGVNGTVPTAGVDSAAIDADGGRVAWSSTGAIAGAPADRKLHVFVRDLRTHETTLVSRADGPEGASADGDSTGPSLDAAGDVVAFQSRAPNLGLPAGSQQVFVRELTTGRTEPISIPGPGDVPGVRASRPSIDAAGDRVSFIAGATTDNAAQAVYVRDRSSQTTEQASRADGADGPASAAPGVLNASIAASGDCVAFDGNFTDLNDGFASADFASVHMRVLRGECPAPAPGDGTGGGGGGPGGEPPAQPVALSALSVRPSRFWTGGRRSGTTIRFKLSHAARVTLRFDRLSTGHRRGRRCVSDRKARGKRCTIVKRVGSMTVKGKAGSNRQRFSGKLKGKRLALGRYRITATVAGGSGKPRAARAVVVRAPKARVKRR